MFSKRLAPRIALAALTLALAQAVQAAPDAAVSATTQPANTDLVSLFQSAETGAEAPGLIGRMRDRATDMVMASLNFLGVPYKRGGTSVESGFDCSGFTRYVFEMSVGRLLPRLADEQARDRSLETVARDQLKPGDLVFFNTLRRTFSHVGIYIGEGKFIHAPRTGAEVRVESLQGAYWAKRFTGARRVPDLHADDAR